MTIATLVKITAAKKLMMKISEKTYDMITARLTAECKKKNFPTERLATFSLENDDGDDCHFVMISLDKYDKQNMRKFEVLLKKDVAIQYRTKPYAFIPDGEDEQLCGINLELISIRQIRKKIEIDSDSDIDEIADKAAARACSKEAALNAEEQAIDEDIEKQMAMIFPLGIPVAPPVLQRQNAMTHRRRRCVPSAESLAAADYQTPEEKIAFAVIDAFEQAELAQQKE